MVGRSTGCGRGRGGGGWEREKRRRGERRSVVWTRFYEDSFALLVTPDFVMPPAGRGCCNEHPLHPRVPVATPPGPPSFHARRLFGGSFPPAQGAFGRSAPGDANARGALAAMMKRMRLQPQESRTAFPAGQLPSVKAPRAICPAAHASTHEALCRAELQGPKSHGLGGKAVGQGGGRTGAAKAWNTRRGRVRVRQGFGWRKSGGVRGEMVDERRPFHYQ